MPFNLRLINREFRYIRDGQARSAVQKSNTAVEFAQGAVLGLLLVAAVVAGYWLIK